MISKQKVHWDYDTCYKVAKECSYRSDLKYKYPQAYRTALKNGWINDPNGLIYFDDVYHMFYQYNPTEPSWDNMHWGHAESRDLIHWEEKDTALFPDNRGTMFSGSAIYDEKNKSEAKRS